MRLLQLTTAAAASLALALLAPPSARAQTLPFSGSSINPGALQSYTFDFGNVVPAAMYSSVTLGGSFQLSAGVGGMAGVTPDGALGPAYFNVYGVHGTASTELATVGTAPCVVTPATVGGTATCAFDPITVTFAPTLFNAIEVLVAYDQTDVGSKASFDGTATLGFGSVVPEPATWALLGAGLVGIGGVARHRRRVPTT